MTLRSLSGVLLGLHNRLFVLLYFWCTIILLTGTPNIEAFIFNSILVAQLRGGKIIALRHWTRRGARFLCEAEY